MACLTASGCAAGDDWDVVVIGAGVGGLIAAREAAREGLNTLIIERRAVPGSKACGGCLNPRALQVLEHVGLAPLIARLNGEQIQGLVLKSGAQCARLALPTGLAVSRHTFDAALLNAAVDAGVRVLMDTSAKVERDSSREFRCVTLRQQNEMASIRARIVVCADGLLRSSLQALPEMGSTAVPNSRVGIGTILDRSAIPETFQQQFPHGQITMIVGRQGYVGVAWAEQGALDIAAAVDPLFLKSVGSPQSAVVQLLAENGVRLPDCSDWRGTPPLTFQAKQNGAERLFVIGDAAGYTEPFTGEGMSAAMEQAVGVVPLVLRGIRHWDPSLAVSWQRHHEQHFVRRQRLCRMASAVLRRPWLTHALVRILGLFPSLAECLVRNVTRSYDMAPVR